MRYAVEKAVATPRPQAHNKRKKGFALHDMFLSSFGDNGTCPRKDSEHGQRPGGGGTFKYEASAKPNAKATAIS